MELLPVSYHNFIVYICDLCVENIKKTKQFHSFHFDSFMEFSSSSSSIVFIEQFVLCWNVDIKLSIRLQVPRNFEMTLLWFVCSNYFQVFIHRTRCVIAFIPIIEQSSYDIQNTIESKIIIKKNHLMNYESHCSTLISINIQLKIVSANDGSTY